MVLSEAFPPCGFLPAAPTAGPAPDEAFAAEAFAAEDAAAWFFAEDLVTALTAVLPADDFLTQLLVNGFRSALFKDDFEAAASTDGFELVLPVARLEAETPTTCVRAADGAGTRNPPGDLPGAEPSEGGMFLGTWDTAGGWVEMGHPLWGDVVGMDDWVQDGGGLAPLVLLLSDVKSETQQNFEVLLA